jgi:flagellar biosynthesis/type III secretory pathway protein FliH
MNTSDLLPGTMQIFARGCILSETLTESAIAAQKQAVETKQAVEAEEVRIEKKAQALAQEMVAREIDTIRKAEQKRRATLEKTWNETVQSLKAEIQKHVLDMSVQIAEIIIQRELPDRAMLRSIIEETLSPVSDLQGLRVRMSPKDCTQFEDATDAIAPQWRSIEWMPDPALGPGDIIVESRNGIFDARIKERLATLREAIASPARHAITSKLPKTGERQ